MFFRNAGARFQRDDGSMVERDEVFEPTEHEYKQRRHKLKPEIERGVSAAAQPTRQVGDEELGDETQWTLAISPAQYLKMHPKGPNAALARRLVGAEEHAE